MVNFGLNSASILGIFLAVAGAGLYFLRSVRPELSRDHDIFFAAVGLLCGLILLFQGWRLDPILQFGQFLLTGAAIFFAAETIRLRGATTEQAKRSGSIVDEERRVSRTRVYTEAELDRLEPYEDEDAYENNRRLRGYPEPRSSRSTGYESQEPRSAKTRRPADRPTDTRETPRKRRPRPSTPPTSDYSAYDAWEDTSESWEEQLPTRRPRRPRPESESPDVSTRPSRKRPSRPPETDFYGRRSEEVEATPTDYVDYQPIDESQTAKMEDADWEQEAASERKPNSDRNEDSPVRFDY
jgi:hypothetical protein